MILSTLKAMNLTTTIQRQIILVTNRVKRPYQLPIIRKAKVKKYLTR